MILKDNTILITGGTSGIGLAFAEEFYKLGNKVIICGRREDRLKKLSEKHPGMVTRLCDVSKEKDRTGLAEWAEKNFNDLNIFINNAGVQYDFDLKEKINLDKLYDEIDTNFVAPIHLANLFAAQFINRHNTAIINISSGLAFVPLAFMPVYCATKAAIHSFTMSLRQQLGSTPVKVFEIAPPSVDTELGNDRRADKTQTHGGMPVDEFLKEAMDAILKNILEAPIAHAKTLREKNEQLFSQMNNR
jgi:uncharacterized oxidoreductase